MKAAAGLAGAIPGALAMAQLAASLIVAVFLAACSSFPSDDSHAYRPGTGVVEAVKVVDEMAPPDRTAGTIEGSPAHEGDRAAAESSVEGYQLTIRMDDGKVQTLTQSNPEFQVGDRVQITRDGRIVKHSG
jgi:hypothetical protein